MKGTGIVFNVDCLLWHNLLFLLTKNFRKAAKQFGLEESVARDLLSMADLPQRFASDVFLSFVIEQKEFPFEERLFPSNTISAVIKSRASFIDFNYWSGLRQLAQRDVEMAMACFGLPRAVVAWVLQASEIELFRMAAGTTDNLTLRYPNALVKEMVVSVNGDEILLCKKAVVAAQLMATEEHI